MRREERCLMSFGRTIHNALLVAACAATSFVAASPARATSPPLSGIVPETVAQASREGLFPLPERAEGLGTSVGQDTWRIPVILVSFSDSLLRYGAADFEKALFDETHSTPTGSLYDYYRWVSGGRLTVLGRVVATVLLPETRSHYGANSWGLNTVGTPQNSYGFAREAIRLCPEGVDWSEFDLDSDGFVDMLWVIHAGLGGEATSYDRDNLWSITSRMSIGWRSGTSYLTGDPIPGSTTQFIRIDRFTILPELSPFHRTEISEIGVYCHEFGHALGLPDLWDTASGGSLNVGPGNWSVMSFGAWGTDGSSPEYPAHLGAWPLQFLGWDHTIRATRDATYMLEPLESQGAILEWWFQGESNPEHFLIENRQRLDFDRNLLAEGLLIYHVDETVIGQRLRSNTINSGPTPGLQLVEADGRGDLIQGRNHGDTNDPFPGGMNRTFINDDTRPSARTFAGAVTQIAAYGIEQVGDNMRVRLQVQAPGWLPAEDYSGPEFRPLDAYGFARVSALDDHGTAHITESEVVAGIPQVMLRESDPGWTEPFQVSNSTGAALGPTLAVLPGGDLAIVWSDYRFGHPQLYYRSRIGGVWTSERLLTNLPGDCLNPAIAADAHGTISLAFQHIVSGQPQIYFMSFTYFSPLGLPVPVTGENEVPGGPAVEVSPYGTSYVMWVERSSQPQRLWFSRIHPDSGVSARQPLVPASTYSQVGMSAVMDGSGGLHVVWVISGPGSSQLHYQRRPGIPDTLLETQGILIQNPVLCLDSDGALHLVFERARGGVMQACYRTWRPGRGWDARSTDLSDPNVAGASRPQPFPTSGGNLSVVYTAYPQDVAHLMLLRRELASAGAIEVPPEPAAVPSRFWIGPNPLRSGDGIEVAMHGADTVTPPRVEFFDLAGRAVASIELRRVRQEWRGRLGGETTRAWPSGIYFARIRARGGEAVRIVLLR